jgi:pimeloyl-ACP methyl ester carboxylesterase
MRSTRQSRTRPVGPDPRSAELLATHERMLAQLPTRRRHVALATGQRVHVVEIGDGPPAVFLHGSNTSSVSFVPLLKHLEGVGVIAVDRPGLGLSDPRSTPRRRFRDATVGFVDQVLDALNLERPTFVGSSMGAVWSLWYAMARPERVRGLAIIGSVPLLPGTQPSAPLRLMATPGLGDLASRIAKPTPQRVVRLLSSVGEGDTIVRYPDLVAAVAAAGRDRDVAAANLAELRAVIQPFGFRRAMRLRPEDLRSVQAPTLFVWGDDDPIGSVDVARSTAELMPDARVEVLPGGHVPYLGNPKRVADLIAGFVRAPGG